MRRQLGAWKGVQIWSQIVCLPWESRGTRTWTIVCYISFILSRTWIGSGAAWIPTNAHMWFWHHKQWLYPLCYNASSSNLKFSMLCSSLLSLMSSLLKLLQIWPVRAPEDLFLFPLICLIMYEMPPYFVAWDIPFNLYNPHYLKNVIILFLWGSVVFAVSNGVRD